MKKIPLLLSIALISSLSFSAIAQEAQEENNTPEEALINIEGLDNENPEVAALLSEFDSLEELERELEISNRRNLSSSLQKSQYRNLISELTLQEQLLLRQISVRDRMLDLRRMEYLLELPIEAHIDRSQYNIPEEESENIPRIDDPSLALKEYRPNTYEADQIIFRERSESKEVESEEESVEQTSNEQERPVVRESRPQEVERGAGTNVTVRTPSIQTPIVNNINTPQRNNDQSNNALGEGETLSDAELEVLGITRAEYQMWVNGGSDVESEENDSLGLSVEESEERVEIKRVNVENIFIFGETRRADISIDFYSGDGITGENEIIKYRGLQQDDIINYNGYRIKVNRITRTDVEVVSTEDGERYIGTATYR